MSSAEVERNPTYDAVVRCAGCGSGRVYVETCENRGGSAGHVVALAIECRRCGHRSELGACPDCEGGRP